MAFVQAWRFGGLDTGEDIKLGVNDEPDTLTESTSMIAPRVITNPATKYPVFSITFGWYKKFIKI